MTTEHETLYTKGPKQLFTTRNSGYQKLAGGLGYTGSRRQVHHVLPCGALTKSREEFIEKHATPDIAALALDRITKFDVNDRPNLMGLPTSEVYAKKYCGPFSIMPQTSALINPLKASAIARCDWPVHLWNHHAYSTAAKTQSDKVWKELALKVKDHEPVSAANLGSALQNVSDAFRRRLDNPAKKAKRTQAAWQSGDKAAFNIY